MFKHMFINDNIMILLKIFKNRSNFEQEAVLLCVQHWTQSRHLPHTILFYF